MKRIFSAVTVVAIFLLLVSSQSFAFRGMGGGNGSPGDRPERPDILAGEPFDITGEVASILFPHGLELSTDDGAVIVRGMAPPRYWEELGMEPPTVGETIQVTGYIVSPEEGVEIYVAMTLVTNDQEVVLRDPDTGEPMWRDMMPNLPHPAPNPGPVTDIASGEPFDIYGEVISIAGFHGLEVETEDGEVVTLFGIGPVPYWEEQGVAFPEVDDYVQASGYIVELNGLERYIVMTMTVDGQVIQLRDSETGKPLWRAPRRPQGPGMGSGPESGMGPRSPRGRNR